MALKNFLPLIFLLIGLWIGAFLMKKPLALPPNEKHFFSDDIVISAKDDEGNPFILKLDLNRKEVEVGQFIHYYTAEIFTKDFQKTVDVDFLAYQKEVSTTKLFATYQNLPAEDLSSRETYHFTMDVDGKILEVTLSGLNGDFLIRNTLEQTKYMSVGKSEVNFDGHAFHGDTAVAKIYSVDYSKTIFFEGFESIRYRTHYFTLWDEKGNFYLIDTTRVENEVPEYKSHTWVLYQDHQAQSLKKFFEVAVDYASEADTPKSWSVTIDPLKTVMQLQPSVFLTDDKKHGVVAGDIRVDGKAMKVFGVFQEEHNP